MSLNLKKPATLELQELQAKNDPIYTARLWKMGGYIRLSRKDLQKINRGLDDSNSVKNQRDILGDFHHSHIDEFESYVA